MLLSVVAALSFWVIDAVVDYFVHYDEPFVSLLLLNRKELAFRLLFSVCFLVFGMIVTRMFDRQKRMENELVREIDERKRIEARLYTLSTKDELTGLFNRRGFFTLVEQQLKMANRDKKTIFLFYADLDNLKEINDSLGHQVGDEALVDIAKILQDTFRESDIIARVGGDEFIAVPVGTTGETVRLISDRVDRNLEIYNSEKTRQHCLSLSFGIVSYDPSAPSTIDELLAQGDRLMYEQKRSKKSPHASAGRISPAD